MVRLKRLSERAAGYGIPGVTVDGNDVLEVFETARTAIERARNGEGPTLVECMTYRITGHSRRDPCNYQPEEERKEALQREPLRRFTEYLLTGGWVDEAGLEGIRAEIDAEIESAVQTALAAPDPRPEAAMEDVFV
jgi:pyruvate dehydrogenase E1 component alpha subunit